jgi:hypothetical protein
MLLGPVWMACDKIDEPLKLIGEEDIPQNIDDTLFFVDSTIVLRKQVLLEDYTGHKCVNCPEWAIFAHELADELNHKLVIIGIHAGYYAKPDTVGGYPADLRTPAGEELYTDFQISANPIGMINRVEYNGNMQINPNSWEIVINEQLATEPVVGLTVRNKYYPNLNTVLINMDAVALTDMAGKYKLCVFITEDHVVSPQKNNNTTIGPTPNWLDYEHMSLLRDDLNTTYGTYISTTGEMVTGEIYKKEFVYKINENWVTENCNIVVYLYNEETWEVAQVAELGIKTE